MQSGLDTSTDHAYSMFKKQGKKKLVAICESVIATLASERKVPKSHLCLHISYLAAAHLHRGAGGAGGAAAGAGQAAAGAGQAAAGPSFSSAAVSKKQKKREQQQQTNSPFGHFGSLLQGILSWSRGAAQRTHLEALSFEHLFEFLRLFVTPKEVCAAEAVLGSHQT